MRGLLRANAPSGARDSPRASAETQGDTGSGELGSWHVQQGNLRGLRRRSGIRERRHKSARTSIGTQGNTCLAYSLHCECARGNDPGALGANFLPMALGSSLPRRTPSPLCSVDPTMEKPGDSKAQREVRRCVLAYRGPNLPTVSLQLRFLRNGPSALLPTEFLGPHSSLTWEVDEFSESMSISS